MGSWTNKHNVELPSQFRVLRPAYGLGDLSQSQLKCGFAAVARLVDNARGPVPGVDSRLAVMSPCLRPMKGCESLVQATAKTKVLPQKLAGTLKEGITHRRVFFSLPKQPNKTSMSLSHVQWAQQHVEARWVPAYDPELAHRANTPSAGQDSRCPTFYTISVNCDRDDKYLCLCSATNLRARAL